MINYNFGEVSLQPIAKQKRAERFCSMVLRYPDWETKSLSDYTCKSKLEVIVILVCVVVVAVFDARLHRTRTGKLNVESDCEYLGLSDIDRSSML